MSQWQQWETRFNALQAREKWLIAASSLLLTVWLLFIMLLEPALQGIDAARQQLTLQQRQYQQAGVVVEQLRQQLGVDHNQSLQQQIDQLKQQQELLNQQIRQSASHFISAEQMVPLLQSVLQQSQTVQLSRLQTLPPVAVSLPGQASDTGALLYQHRVKLTLIGTYAELSSALQSIEQLPWAVNWQALQYQVTRHPQAEMTLELATVSEHEDIIRL